MPTIPITIAGQKPAKLAVTVKAGEDATWQFTGPDGASLSGILNIIYKSPDWKTRYRLDAINGAPFVRPVRTQYGTCNVQFQLLTKGGPKDGLWGPDVVLTVAAADSQPILPVEPEKPADPAPGVMDFGVVDYFQAAHDAGLDKFGIVGNRVWINPQGFGTYVRNGNATKAINLYKSTGAHPILCVASHPVLLKDLPRAAGWMKAFALDIKANAPAGMKRRFEFINEPDLVGNPPYLEGNDIARYVSDGLVPSYNAIKEVDPDALVIGGNFSWNWTLFSKWAAAIAKGCDAFGYHGYAASVNEFERYEIIHQMGKAHNRPIYLTECGLGYGKLMKADPANREKYIARALADMPGFIQYVSTRCREMSFFTTIKNGGTNDYQALTMVENGRTVLSPFAEAVRKGLVLAGIASPVA